MKNQLLTLIYLIFIFGCKDNTTNASTQSAPNQTEAQKASAKVENFECEIFFKKGDYSSLCFTNKQLPEYIASGCIFDFIVKGDKHEQDLKIQFVGENSAMLAEMQFNLNKSNYKKGEITDVSDLGDAAFFDVHSTDLKSLSRSNKDLSVRYNNITFTIMAGYQSTTEMPCFYNDKDLIAFAETIINNL